MFTMDNTEGFTQNQLDELNTALEALVADGWNEKTASDRLNNVWNDDCQTADDLVWAATKS